MILDYVYALISVVVGCDLERQEVRKPIIEISPDNSKNCSMCSRDYKMFLKCFDMLIQKYNNIFKNQIFNKLFFKIN
jgi:hypothetical protein